MTVKAIISAQNRGLKFVTIANRRLSLDQQAKVINEATRRGIQNSASKVEKLVASMPLY